METLMLDKLSFRDAMAGLGAAVNIVTSDGAAGVECSHCQLCSRLTD